MRFRVSTLLLIATVVAVAFAIPLSIYGRLSIDDSFRFALWVLMHAPWSIPLLLILLVGSVFVWRRGRENKNAAILAFAGIVARVMAIYLDLYRDAWILSNLSKIDRDVLRDIQLNSAIVTWLLITSSWLLIVIALVMLLKSEVPRSPEIESTPELRVSPGAAE